MNSTWRLAEGWPSAFIKKTNQLATNYQGFNGIRNNILKLNAALFVPLGCIFHTQQMACYSFFDTLLQNILEASIWEIVAVVFGVVSVWFARKANILVFPAGIVSTAIYIFIFFVTGLYANMGINVYYTCVSLYGWYHWTRKRNSSRELPVSWNTKKEQIAGILLLPVIFLLILGLLWVVQSDGHQGFRFTFVTITDALTTAIFILGMWFLARKKIENWIYWIAGNIISIPFFFTQDLIFTSLQFVIFLILAIMGFQEWKRLYNKAGLQ